MPPSRFLFYSPLLPYWHFFWNTTPVLRSLCVPPSLVFFPWPCIYKCIFFCFCCFPLLTLISKHPLHSLSHPPCAGCSCVPTEFYEHERQWGRGQRRWRCVVKVCPAHLTVYNVTPDSQSKDTGVCAFVTMHPQRGNAHAFDHTLDTHKPSTSTCFRHPHALRTLVRVFNAHVHVCGFNPCTRSSTRVRGAFNIRKM